MKNIKINLVPIKITVSFSSDEIKSLTNHHFAGSMIEMKVKRQINNPYPPPLPQQQQKEKNSLFPNNFFPF